MVLVNKLKWHDVRVDETLSTKLLNCNDELGPKEFRLKVSSNSQ